MMAPHDDSTASRARRAQLLRELAPAGLLQTMLVEQVARAMDRVDRADALEDVHGPLDPEWRKFQAQAERSFYRALGEFHRLRKADIAAHRVPAARPSKPLDRPPTPPAARGVDPSPRTHAGPVAPAQPGGTTWERRARSLASKTSSRRRAALSAC